NAAFTVFSAAVIVSLELKWLANTEKLIEIVKQYPIIYDLRDEDYKNIRKKDKVWDNNIIFEKFHNSLNFFADSIHIWVDGSEELKKKWKNLRDSYAKHIRSLKTTTGQSAKKLHKWQWANQMEFFRSFLSFAKTTSNIADVPPDTENTDSEYINANIQTYEVSQSPVCSRNLQNDELAIKKIDPILTNARKELRRSRVLIPLRK
ncbi:uncharacterized protein, partial [Diabrotica undecimpunctata]|uniref:uncharacterized protein n=1 Tax=Diabrotica undecimpunctata TaxID=50387 RepID=UPI003B635192